MSTISINPLSFAQRQFIDPKGNPNAKEISKFLSDLGQWANQVQQILINPQILASNLNGNSALFISSLKLVSRDLGTVSTNQTVDCTNAAIISVRMVISTAVNLTLTLANIVSGAFVCITFHNGAVSAQTLTVACTGAVTAVRWKFSGAAIVSMDTAGTSIAAGGDVIASGSVIDSVALYQVAN